MVDQRNVILWDNSVDITDDAIQAINQALGMVLKLIKKYLTYYKIEIAFRLS